MIASVVNRLPPQRVVRNRAVAASNGSVPGLTIANRSHPPGHRALPTRFEGPPSYVDQILKGAVPGNIPVEQASTYLKVAEALGREVPSSFLIQATRRAGLPFTCARDRPVRGQLCHPRAAMHQMPHCIPLKRFETVS